jgi:hypothetical protein
MHWVTVGSFLVGGTLVFSACAKALAPGTMVDALLGQLLHRRAVALSVAWAVIVAELSVGLALVLGLFVRVAAVGAAGLLLAFAALVAARLRRHLGGPCGCFGRVLEEEIHWGIVARNGALALVALAVAGAARPENWRASAATADTATAAGAAIVGLLTLLMASYVVAMEVES